MLQSITFRLADSLPKTAINQGDVIVQLEKLPSISLEESLGLDLRVQRVLMEQVPEVVGVVARTGSDKLGMDPMGLNQTNTFLVLRPREEWRFETKDELLDAMRSEFDGFAGIAYGFTQPIEMRVSEMLTGVRGDVAITLFGSDLDLLNEKAAQIADLVRGIAGSEDVWFTENEGVQYLQIEGLEVGTIYEGTRRTPLLLGDAADLRSSPAAFENLRLTLPDGRLVSLSSIARIERFGGPVQVGREQGNRLSVVIANVRGRDLVGFVEEAKALVAEQVELPARYYVQWGASWRTSSGRRRGCPSSCPSPSD